MTLVDAAAIVFGLFAGYWVVSRLLFRSPRAPAPLPTPAALPAARAAGAAAPWHQVLEVPPTAGAEQIHAAYRQLISQYHPDKVEHLGPELRELAARKAREITAAYQEGLRARGESP